MNWVNLAGQIVFGLLVVSCFIFIQRAIERRRTSRPIIFPETSKGNDTAEAKKKEADEVEAMVIFLGLGGLVIVILAFIGWLLWSFATASPFDWALVCVAIMLMFIWNELTEMRRRVESLEKFAREIMMKVGR